MIEVLQFVFSSFWVWLGSTIMLSVVVAGLGYGLGNIRGVLAYGIRRG